MAEEFHGSIAVVGAGVMGAGVAQTTSEFGLATILIDLSDEVLEQARQRIREGVRAANFARPKGERVQAADLLGRIVFSTTLESVREADVIVENITEQWSLKASVYDQLNQLKRESALLLVNTSVFPITKIGRHFKDPEHVVGVHFMNPVRQKPTAEVIRGYHTSDDSLARTLQFLAAIGKEGIVVQDAPGFVSNRVLMLTINEAIFTVHEGTATARDVDAIFKRCFGHPMGPLETGDLIGLDTILLSLEGLYQELNDPKFRPCPLLRKMVDAGLLGRKSGRGFHDYT